MTNEIPSLRNRYSNPYQQIHCQKIIHILNLTPSIKKRNLYNLFNSYGEIKEIVKCSSGQTINSDSSSSRDFLISIVTNKTLFKQLNQLKRSGKLGFQFSIIHSKLNKNNKLLKGHKVFFRNIPQNKKISMLQLAQYFIKFGQIQYLYPVVDTKSSVCKGYGFISYKSKESAVSLIEESESERGLYFEGKRLFCESKNSHLKKTKLRSSISTNTDLKSMSTKNSEFKYPSPSMTLNSYDNDGFDNLNTENSRIDTNQNEDSLIYFRFGPPIDYVPISDLEDDDWKYLD